MQHFLSKEQYLAVKQHWAQSEVFQKSAAYHIIYNILRSLPLDRGFTPIQKPNKITSCSNDPWFGYNNAIRNISATLLTMPDTSIEAYLERFNGKSVIKKTIFGKDIIPKTKLSIWQEDWRQKEISRQAKVKEEFQTFFGLELTPELGATIFEALKGARKEVTQ
jgi:hypothetical protein